MFSGISDTKMYLLYFNPIKSNSCGCIYKPSSTLIQFKFIFYFI